MQITEKYREIWDRVQEQYTVSDHLERIADQLLNGTKRATKRPYRKANKKELERLVEDAVQIHNKMRDILSSSPEVMEEYLAEASESLSAATMLLQEAFDNVVTGDAG